MHPMLLGSERSLSLKARPASISDHLTAVVRQSLGYSFAQHGMHA
jgi:uncharacterized membrane protein YphA (DoxX/SURF4 family)